MTNGSVNSLWNQGFGNPDSDPSNAPSNGSVLNHVLVPDGIAAIPEPGSLILLGTGLVGLMGLRRKNR